MWQKAWDSPTRAIDDKKVSTRSLKQTRVAVSTTRRKKKMHHCIQKRPNPLRRCAGSPHCPYQPPPPTRHTFAVCTLREQGGREGAEGATSQHIAVRTRRAGANVEKWWNEPEIPSHGRSCSTTKCKVNWKQKHNHLEPSIVINQNGFQKKYGM